MMDGLLHLYLYGSRGLELQGLGVDAILTTDYHIPNEMWVGREMQTQGEKRCAVGENGSYLGKRLVREVTASWLGMITAVMYTMLRRPDPLSFL